MLLKNPEILLFDEATASLDSTSEKIIQDAIRSISQE
jgi:ABC-type multidrug transport system fused ATPase/permease subunit